MFPDLEKILPAIEALTEELKVLNGHLLDLKKMIASYLGWKVIEEEKKK